MRLIVAATAASIAFSVHPVASQAAAEKHTLNCRPAQGSSLDQGSAPETLSDKLKSCDGVLKAPKIGDKEMVEPAPHVGTMPVIPPGAVPQQPSSEALGSKTELN
ncbi:hypothetical protein FJW04_18150 [Mesorhizobium sp. B2-7-3]|uniref:hypothetical protein n=1 Tax=Mesorhizobium sp. B2-7-3 TaxID=2589907 RepID=UPI0011289886|nr:hypothetical protein [Mesorhizobium sp. B2-7-3]TPJ14407.1 hypothetical protein FJW04_18150 [Mesorhizobium sp. B2-7-3]